MIPVAFFMIRNYITIEILACAYYDGNIVYIKKKVFICRAARDF